MGIFFGISDPGRSRGIVYCGLLALAAISQSQHLFATQAGRGVRCQERLGTIKANQRACGVEENSKSIEQSVGRRSIAEIWPRRFLQSISLLPATMKDTSTSAVFRCKRFNPLDAL